MALQSLPSVGAASSPLDKMYDKIRQNIEEQKALSDETASVLVGNVEVMDAEALKKEHDPGKYRTQEAKKVDLKANSNYALYGWVDQQVYRQERFKRDGVTKRSKFLYRPRSFYKRIREDAKRFLAVKEYIKVDFPNMYAANWEKIEAILTKVASMPHLHAGKWLKMYDKEGFTEDEITGSTGLYNILLAFRRAVEPLKNKGLLELDEDGDLKNPELFITIADEDGITPLEPPQLAILIGMAKDSGNRRVDRYSRVIEIKREEKHK
jgi:hypothetical protein